MKYSSEKIKELINDSNVWSIRLCKEVFSNEVKKYYIEYGGKPKQGEISEAVYNMFDYKEKPVNIVGNIKKYTKSIK